MRRGARLAALLLFAAAGPLDAGAHELRPGYLELREIDARAWDLLFKVPVRGGRRLPVDVVLPEDCRGAPPPGRSTAGGYVERWRASCETGLVGRRIVIGGLALTRTDVLVRVERADGSSQSVRLTPEAPGLRVSATPGWAATARTYFGLGLEHILLGSDHLLFVLALVFLVTRGPRLVGTVTSFTLAHSLTLAAATLGWVHVAQLPVEAVIALSIVFVATEVARASRGRPALASRRPWLVAFAFGLLHGLGFAGALRDAGLPHDSIPAALASFNVGVEVGQLLFLAAVFGVFQLLRRAGSGAAGDSWAVAARLARPAAYAIGIPAAFWLIERTARFWG